MVRKKFNNLNIEYGTAMAFTVALNVYEKFHNKRRSFLFLFDKNYVWEYVCMKPGIKCLQDATFVNYLSDFLVTLSIKRLHIVCLWEKEKFDYSIDCIGSAPFVFPSQLAFGWSVIVKII